jgi:DNA modification methylase
MERRGSLNANANAILVGSALELAGKMPSGCVDCVVTSPPYFGHRTYAAAHDPAELGRERHVSEYVDRLTETLCGVGRLLRDDGTLWLNLGDTYRNGQLCGVPWRVALALQDHGWLLRSDIIWHKPNAMPAALKTRPTTDHEYVFVLSKHPEYYYDADAIREPHVTFSDRSKMRGGRAHFGKVNGTPERGKNGGSSNLHDGRWDQAFHPNGRNKRTVWSIPLGKFREAHFAVFPERLVEPCIKAGCRPGGVVLDPFMGSGTVGVVASRLGRKYLGFELVAESAAMAERRIADARTRGPDQEALPFA